MGDYSTYSDEHLVALLKNSNEEAFKEIYERYYRPLSVYAYNFANTRDEALDIAQDIFVSLWKLRRDILLKHSLKAYLYQSVRNGCVRLMQKQLKKEHFFEDFSRFLETSGNSSPIARLEAADMEEQVSKAISSMTPVMRKVFLLSRENQLSHREIAGQMNMAENTAKKHIQNALKLVKARLDVIPGAIYLCISQLF